MYMNVSHATDIHVHLEGANGAINDVVNIGGIFCFVLSRATAGL